MADWAREHVPRAEDTVRIDFYLLDGPFAVVHRVALNEHGSPFDDPATCGIAMEGPGVLALAELPPECLLGA
jgi:hypothetical protein